MGDAALSRTGGIPLRDDIYWLWLSLLNVSVKARSAVIRQFGSAECAFHSKEGSFRTVKGVTAKEAELLEERSLQNAETCMELCDKLRLSVLPITDPVYPERLKEIFFPPPVLYLQGKLLPVDDLPVVSVIGTRRASPYGIKMGQRIAYEVSKCGGTVLSLLTSGIDEAAAVGMLRSGKPGIAVLGTSHDHCKSDLLQDIASNGSVVSEYPPGKQLSKHFFRERNRIAAGLSVGVVVVEAPEKSGTRFFVTDAVEQGKDVFAIPGNADAENSIGTLSMLKEGAKLVTCGADVMEEYELRFPERICRDGFFSRFEDESDGEDAENLHDAEKKEQAPAVKTESDSKAIREKYTDLTEEQLLILQNIGHVPAHVDEITDKTGLTVPKVLAQLTVLEIKGIVSRKPGKLFCLKD